MKIFFSHCNSDKDIVSKMIDLIDSSNSQIFFSSLPELGISAGESIMKRINEEMENCDVFVPVITQNYLRSIYCIYELSLAIYLKHKTNLQIVPISTQKTIQERMENFLSTNILNVLYIDVAVKANRSKQFKIFPIKSEVQDKDIDNVLEEINNQNNADRPFIGMLQSEYEAIIQYCEKYKIQAFRNTNVSNDKIVSHVSNAKEVIILSTTGASLLKTLCAGVLVEAIAHGTQVNIILPNQYSSFCEDVAEIERPSSKEDNLARIAQEYTAVMGYLNEAIEKAKSLIGKNEIGKVFCYCSYTLLRQTVLLTISSKGEMWGNVSLTIPPKKTVDGTPSIEIVGQEGVQGSLAEIMREHCREIISVAERRGGVIEVTGKYQEKCFFDEKYHAMQYWNKKYETAVVNMREKYENCSDVLIEVAAQHPLKKGEKPGIEFTKRLDAAIHIYNDLVEKKEDVFIYVPGSIHRTSSQTDKVSLSYAGCEYLLLNGIPQNRIFGEDANLKYKGEDGVYNSADECYVASKLFQEGDFKQIYCVCSPNQVMRKTLFYIEFGVVPQCFSIPSNAMYHNVLDEIFNSLENVIYRDHCWQDKSSDAFIESRKSRKPE
ncbi:MAG: toll/interleukin-1 receptor domain-containing protein [Anaeroplasmataceae bacterium]|nr:toll/interleukin-1 receptor domain-containing protein [Anaeroplasmataceae bacterium]